MCERWGRGRDVTFREGQDAFPALAVCPFTAGFRYDTDLKQTVADGTVACPFPPASVTVLDWQ